MWLNKYKKNNEVIRYKISIAILIGIGMLSAQTVLSVQPASISDRTLMSGDTLTIDIYIEDVSNLYAYQFALQYNPDVLTVASVNSGYFLSQGGTTYCNCNNWRRYGLLFVIESLVGAVPGVNGSGVLIKIVFRVNKRGKTYLDLSYTRAAYMDYVLLNPYEREIGFTTLNGAFSNE